GDAQRSRASGRLRAPRAAPHPAHGSGCRRAARTRLGLRAHGGLPLRWPRERGRGAVRPGIGPHPHPARAWAGAGGARHVRMSPPREMKEHSMSSHVVIEPSVLYVGTPAYLIGTRHPDGSPSLAAASSYWALGRIVVL